MRENVNLAPFTTLGVGGNARWWVEVETEGAVRDAFARADRIGLPAFLLGGGSNLVVADSGFSGVVVKVDVRGLHTEIEPGGNVLATVGAGEDWDSLVRTAAENGWAGIECLAGIPGTVGATPIQNVGAYGQDVSETIVHVRAFDRVEKTVVRIDAADCRFGYRSSRFNTGEMGRFAILSVTFSLRAGGAPTLKYPELRRYFETRRPPTLKDVYRGVREIRAQKGMVVDPKDHDSRSAGSFFKNPTLAAKSFAALESVWREKSGDPTASIPNYPQRDGTVKVPAAWLIERSGFSRGQDLGGGIAISSKHVLALVNRKDATGAAVVDAACRIQAAVRAAWELRLSPEPLFLGFPDDATLPEGALRAEKPGKKSRLKS